MFKNKRSKLPIRIQKTRQGLKPSSTKSISERRKNVRNDKLADFQLNWSVLIPVLEERSICNWQKVTFLSVMGDAPKDFITDREDQIVKRSKKVSVAKYIAKLGSKFYPLESVIEQFLTRIGQCYKLTIADSKLRIVEGQVRFMSKYFLRKDEQLTHGAEILALCLGKAEYEQLEKEKRESEYFTFQMVCEAIREAFPDDEKEIIGGFIQMLAFDALIGHNDRHPYNWGILVPISKDRRREFAPIYDTARALFWNIPEDRIQQMLTDQGQLEAYVRRCPPAFCWDGEDNIDFFKLLGLIWSRYPEYRDKIETLLSVASLDNCIQVLDEEFSRLISIERCELIKRCLCLRQKLLSEAVLKFKIEEEIDV